MRRLIAIAVVIFTIDAFAASIEGSAPGSAVSSSGVSNVDLVAPNLTLHDTVSGVTTMHLQATIDGWQNRILLDSPLTCAVTLTDSESRIDLLGCKSPSTFPVGNGAVVVADVNSETGWEGPEFLVGHGSSPEVLMRNNGAGSYNLVRIPVAFEIGNTVSGVKPAPIEGSYREVTTLDVASIAANTCATDISISLTPAQESAECFVGMPASITAGIQGTCFVSAAGTVKLRLCNNGSAASDPPSATYAVRIFNPPQGTMADNW